MTTIFNTTFGSNDNVDNVVCVPFNPKFLTVAQPMLSSSLSVKELCEFYPSYAEHGFSGVCAEVCKNYLTSLNFGNNFKVVGSVLAYVNCDTSSTPIVSESDFAPLAWNYLCTDLINLNNSDDTTYLIYGFMHYYDRDTNKLVASRLECKKVTHKDLVESSRTSSALFDISDSCVVPSDIILVDNVKPEATMLVIHAYPIKEKVMPSFNLICSDIISDILLKNCLYFRDFENDAELPTAFRELDFNITKQALGCNPSYCVKDYTMLNFSKVQKLRNNFVFAVHSESKLESFFENNDKSLHYKYPFF